MRWMFICLTLRAATSLPVMKASSWAARPRSFRRGLGATIRGPPWRRCGAPRPPPPSAGAPPGGCARGMPGRRVRVRRLAAGQPRVEGHRVRLRVALLFTEHRQGGRRAGVDALEAALAVLVGDAAKADEAPSLRRLVLAPDEAEVGTDEVAQAAVDARRTVEGRDEALPGGGEGPEDGVARVEKGG